MTHISTRFILLCSLASTVLTSRLAYRNVTSQCQKTKVAILGAGVAGITAAQALHNSSVEDFIIVEYNGEIGGRCRHTTFGKDPDGKPYTVELGANWVQGIGSPGGPTNPIWDLVQRFQVENYFSNLSSLETFDASGPVDYTSKIDDFGNAYSFVEQDAGYIEVDNLQDRSFRGALRLGGWNPTHDYQAQAVEWLEMDYEYAQTPDTFSELFSIVNYNTTYYGFSEANNYVFDQRGFNAFIYGEASQFLKANDTRLKLNTIVTNISYSDDGVIVTNKDGSCIAADYAITTFSVGVLQSGDVSFSPALPDWKEIAIQEFQMGVYTKIFFQFPPDQVFWDKNTQFFLYASKTRGYYPLWQSLDNENFLPGSGIFFVTVVTEMSYVVEMQDDETTKQQILVTLRQMFGADNVPDPIDFMYPRWGTTPWAYGSYSNWPIGTTLEKHQNLRANVGRVFFAGEATSAEFYGYLQAAYFEGQSVGQTIAGYLNGSFTGSASEVHYDTLHGTSPFEDYNIQNGWRETSFQTIGDVGLSGGGG